MKENRFELGFALIIILMTILSFINSTSIAKPLVWLFLIQYFCWFLAWLISIIRTVKERSIINLIPCILVSILLIIGFIMVKNEPFVKIYGPIMQCGLHGAFIYEIMDILKIQYKFNIINIITTLICVFLIITFLLGQVISVNETKESFENIYKVVSLNNLTYRQKIDEIDSLVLDGLTKNEYLSSSSQVFRTPAKIYRSVYYSLVDNIKDSISEYKGRVEIDESYKNVMASKANDANIIVVKVFIVWMFTIVIEHVIGIKNRKNVFNF